MEAHSVPSFAPAVVESWSRLLLFPLKPRGYIPPMTRPASCLRKIPGPCRRQQEPRCTCPASRTISPGRCAPPKIATPCRELQEIDRWIPLLVPHGRETAHTSHS